MVRPALIALAVILLLSVVLVSRPVPPPPTPNRGVVLENVRLTLYPEQDPGSHWEFAAGKVEQDPATREAKVTQLKTGERYVNTRLDMRLTAPEVTIDRADNLRMTSATAEILKGCYTVRLGSENGQLVEIDQREGFRAATVQIDSPSYKATGTQFKSDFGIENPSWRSPNETFISGGQKPPCPIPGGSS